MILIFTGLAAGVLSGYFSNMLRRGHLRLFLKVMLTAFLYLFFAFTGVVILKHVIIANGELYYFLPFSITSIAIVIRDQVKGSG